MRTLNRPMFKMGGPIKEGVMHGIREPHFKGQIVGKAMPHIQRAWRGFQGLFGSRGPITRTVPRQGPPYNIPGGSQYSKGYPGPKVRGQNVGPGSVEVTEQIFTPKPWAAATGKYLASSPEGRAVKWIWDGKGWVAKTAKGIAKSPTAAIGLTYAGGRWLWPDGTEATDAEITNIQKPGGYPKDKSGTKAPQTGSAGEFAQKQRDIRIKKYLDLMGYDSAKKTAVADALIDASKIVSDRGTLDRKNITGELINPIIQATSKRFDKPNQIREALGLMMAKADLEKEMYDAKPGTVGKTVQDMVASGRFTPDEAWAIATKQGKGVGADLLTYMASKKGKVRGDELVDFVRLSATDKGKSFKQITEEEVKAVPGFENKSAEEVVTSIVGNTDGIYMIGDSVIEITGGVPTQIK